MGFFDNESSDVLLAPPVVLTDDSGTEHLERSVRKEFFNIPPLDFTLPDARASMIVALEELRAQTEKEPIMVSPIVNGLEIECAESTFSTAPERPNWKLATVGLASKELAEGTVQALKDFFPTWRDTPMAQRAEVLFRAAAIMTTRRIELTAIVSAESGKPWKEADGDLAEAVDFLNYYAHEAIKLGQKHKMGNLPGEQNTYFYEPRGITLVVSPWNFPLAIPCGMLSASLVTGNVSIIKPATNSALIASKVVEILIEAGLPPQAVAFMPGRGQDIGEYLGAHPDIHTIIFTGSKEVGLGLIKSAAEVPHGQQHVKRVIAEMGGKNAIIIDEDADLDEAIKGVVYSAFGYQGQKCSACSRAFVVGTAYKPFVERLAAAVQSLPVGPATSPSTFVGPVIDSKSKAKLLQVIKMSESECSLIAKAEVPNDGSNAHYVPPTAFTDIPEGHTLLREELFGPILAVAHVDSFDAALEKAEDCEYALTGAIFSRSPANITKAVQNFRVGNLYVNRGCTAAIVMRQPFGGFKLSGVGSKAGGPDYLLQFCNPRSVTENTMRRGFTPDLS
jgi:RHH-type proline utilization regulon transcriptional repressor/proline dehydrogenase/delta 1-pyrroline-5-carboxylate dehydrogenase